MEKKRKRELRTVSASCMVQGTNEQGGALVFRVGAKLERSWSSYVPSMQMQYWTMHCTFLSLSHPSRSSSKSNVSEEVKS